MLSAHRFNFKNESISVVAVYRMQNSFSTTREDKGKYGQGGQMALSGNERVAGNSIGRGES
ncbi:hypothetical protein SRABI106_04457 [Rahnella aquatilis]|nr:hypothetical protein SRABI106_04457 [Rahnella aquatilis]